MKRMLLFFLAISGSLWPAQAQTSTAPIDPYLQNVTESSIYVCWHSENLSTSIVEYGTDSSLSQQATGTYDTIGEVNYWHTVHLTGLSADTRYYYRCISGHDTSAISSFHTRTAPGQPARHLRFVVTGDSRTDTAETRYISTVIEKQLKNDYGSNWNDSVAFLINVGDIVTNGNTISQYKPEYFLPYSNLTRKIPFYVSIGNHEAESPYYYEYMKYEDLTGPPYDDPANEFNEKFYTFRAGRCRFIALNSNWSYWRDEQTNWLKKQLDEAEANEDIDFVFIYCHHPGHTEIWPDGNTIYTQGVIIPLLRQYSKPAMFIYGHSHDYERGVIELDQDNPGYHNDMYLLLSGGGGAPLDRWGMYSNQRDYPEIFKTLDHYNYSIIDVDQVDQAFYARTYSLGNPDKPLDNVLIDTWYSKINQPKPDTPEAQDPLYENDTIIVFRGSAFSGVDSLFSSQIQVTKTPGDYSQPVLNTKRDVINIYGDTGDPDYEPIDKNDTVDITVLKMLKFTFPNATYGWRIRYRDHNMKWSDWSPENIFSVTGVHTPRQTAMALHFAPNPVSRSAKIIFETQTTETVTLKIYSLDNREVAVLLDRQPLPAGHHEIPWTPEGLTPGVYLMHFTSGAHTATCKIILTGEAKK